MPLAMLRHARTIRVRAFLLLATFVAGGISLPSLDALLYHQRAHDARTWHDHVEPAGGCLDHGERCVLGRTATGAGAAPEPGGEVRIEYAGRSSRPAQPTQRGLHSHLGTLPPQRAPPALA